MLRNIYCSQTCALFDFENAVDSIRAHTPLTMEESPKPQPPWIIHDGLSARLLKHIKHRKLKITSALLPLPIPFVGVKSYYGTGKQGTMASARDNDVDWSISGDKVWVAPVFKLKICSTQLDESLMLSWEISHGNCTMWKFYRRKRLASKARKIEGISHAGNIRIDPVHWKVQHGRTKRDAKEANSCH